MVGCGWFIKFRVVSLVLVFGFRDKPNPGIVFVHFFVPYSVILLYLWHCLNSRYEVDFKRRLRVEIG